MHDKLSLSFITLICYLWNAYQRHSSGQALTRAPRWLHSRRGMSRRHATVNLANHSLLYSLSTPLLLHYRSEPLSISFNYIICFVEIRAEYAPSFHFAEATASTTLNLAAACASSRHLFLFEHASKLEVFN